MLIKFCAICFWTLLCFVAHGSPGRITFPFVSFTTNQTNRHLVVNKINGDVFVGAKNRIYQLNSHLELIGVQKVGPFEDSPACFGYRDRICPSDSVEREITDNYNKALLIDYDQKHLIHCGSVFQGVCWIVGLDNVSNSEIDIVDRPVVANDQNSSTVAFIAPGPPDPGINKVLYVAVSFTGNSRYRHNVPSISSRTLEMADALDYAAGGGSENGPKTGIFIATRSGFPVRYIYGFSHGGFSYFVSVQKRSSVRNSPHASKLIRVCQKDTNFSSYTEIPIECKASSTSSRKYPLAQAAVLGRAGPALARQLQVNDEYDEVLYVTFSTSASYGSDSPGEDSALCVFSMQDIRTKFQQNIQNCFNGNGRRGLDFITKDAPCVKVDMEITEDFCGSGINSPLGGEIPVVANAVIVFQGEVATAVASSVVGETTVAFIGTRKGEIKKVAIEKFNEAKEYDSIVVERGESILPDLAFDPSETHLYALTRNKVLRLPLHGKCSRHENCKDCTAYGDPYCGWCSAQSRCMQLNSCTKMYTGPSSTWISWKSTDKCGTSAHCGELASDCTTCQLLDPSLECGWCQSSNACQHRTECYDSSLLPNCTNPQIISFQPLTAPIEGGTEITIRVANMPTTVNTGYLAVTVAGVRCSLNIPGTFEAIDPYDGQLKCKVIRRPKLYADERSGPVVIHAHLRISSSQNFSFVTWEMSQISPTVGPLRGGTRLNIYGTNLDAGTAATVKVGDAPCAILRRTNATIECITGSFYERGTFGVKVSLDDNEKQLPPVFSYVDDPILVRIKNHVIHGTLRGGNHIYIEGRHLDAVQQAFMVVTINGTDYLGSCNITTEDFLHCDTPKIDEDAAILRADAPIESEETTEDVLVVPYKFELDSVETFVANVSAEKHQYFLRLSNEVIHHHHEHEPEGSYTFAIVVTVLLLLLILGIAGFCLWKRRKLNRVGGSAQYMLTATEMEDFQKGQPKQMDKDVLSNENPYVVPYNQKFEIPEKRFILDLDAILGSGNFGVVTKGVVDGTPVAVKTVKPDAEKLHVMSLMSELKILVYLGNSGKHPNIVNLVGSNTKNLHKGLLYVFVEYCPLGSLDKYLRSHRSCFCNQVEGDAIDVTATADRYENLDPTKILCTLDLINFAHQIAKGMEYLAEKKVIHADLATRNLLLYDKTTVKITDFGLARKLYDYTNYVKKHQEPLPWRWMAIESLRDLSFSHQSDVWAYGITLWEIFTLGELPYPGLSWGIDFTHRLQQGLQNVKPKFATNDIYNTMRECWRLNPEERPLFGDIRKFFNSMLTELSAQVQEHYQRIREDPDGYLLPLLPQNNS